MSTFDAWSLAIDTGHAIDGWIIGLLQIGAALGDHLVFFAVAAAGWWAIGRIRARRALRRTPAAPDNHAGTDTDLLITCRRIDAAGDTRKEKP